MCPPADDGTIDSRRRFLVAAGTGAAVLLAGCSGGGGGGGGGTEATDPPTATTAAGTGEADGDDGGDDRVPDAEATATALGGRKRNPDAVSTKEAVSYQDEPKDGQQCTGCTYYIPDRTGDGLGACAIVAGTIDPEGWCVSYVPTEG
jgi:hypothetical protein